MITAAVCEARAARSDIYRSRFHPISAVLLTPTLALALPPARTSDSVSSNIVAQMNFFRIEFGGHCFIGGDMILMGRNDL